MKLRHALYFVVLITPIAARGNILDTEPQTRSNPVIETPEAVKIEPFTGSASYQYPFEVPPGTGGLTPKLALTYSSLTKGSEFGWGWRLSLSRIERCTRFGVPKYDDAQDRFEIDGELLVSDPDTSNRYHKTHTDFSRIMYYPGTPSERSYWEVTTPDGIRMRYGSRIGANSRLTNGPELAGAVFRWALDEVIDPSGNSYRIDYEPDFTSGAVGTRTALYVFPRFIRYSFHGEAEGSVPGRARRLIVFDWGPRGGAGEDIDRPTSLRAGFKVQIARRLTGVRIGLTANTDGTFAAGEQIRRYGMSYAPKFSSASADALRSPPFSELASIQRYGSDDTPFPSSTNKRPTLFTYTRPARPRTLEESIAATTSTSAGTTTEPGGNAIRFPFDHTDTVGAMIDMNGDGAPDQVRTAPNAGPRNWIVRFGPPENFRLEQYFDIEYRWLWCASDAATSCTEVVPADVADRLTDVGTVDAGDHKPWTVIKSDLVDMDGDGLVDWIGSTQTADWTFRKNLDGYRFGPPQVWSAPNLVISGGQQNAGRNARYINSVQNSSGIYVGWSRLIDLDGDGLPDHLASNLLDPNSMWFSRNRGCTSQGGCGFEQPRNIAGRNRSLAVAAAAPAPLSVDITYSYPGTGADPNNVIASTHEIVDVNGDGLPDLVSNDSCFDVAFGTGAATGFPLWTPQGYPGGSTDCGQTGPLAVTEMRRVPGAPSVPTAQSVEQTLFDANGDGILDRVVLAFPIPSIALGLGDGTFSHSLLPRDPAGDSPDWIRPSFYPAPSTQGYGPIRSSVPGTLTDTYDVDGDGLLDQVSVFAGSWSVTRASGPEGLLSSVQTELGATTSITYSRFSEFRVNPEVSADPPLVADPIEPELVPSRRTMWAVSEIDTSDGRPGTPVQRRQISSYTGSRYNFALRENRGYQFLEATDAASTRTSTTYNQHKYDYGLVAEERISSGSPAVLQKKTSWSWGIATPRNESGDLIPGSGFVSAKTETTSIFSGSAHQDRTMSRTLDSKFGFVTYERDSNLETRLTYEPVDTANWLLRLPRARYQQAVGNSSPSSRINDETRDYSPQGLLTKRTVLRHDPSTNLTDSLEENWGYDSFGNVSQYWPASRPRTAVPQTATTWDSLYSTFPVVVAKQDGGSTVLTTSYAFNPGLGSATKSLSPRSYLECWDYDTFGRLYAKRDSPTPSSIDADCSTVRFQFVFHDALVGSPSAQYLSSLESTLGSGALENRQYFDGLGRVYREADQASSTDYFVTAKSWNGRGELSCQSEPVRAADPGVASIACGTNSAPSHIPQFDALLRLAQRTLRMPAGSGTADRVEDTVTYPVFDHDGIAGNEVVETHTIIGSPNLQREIGKDQRGNVVSVRTYPGTPTYLRRDAAERITLVDGPDLPASSGSPNANLLVVTYNSEGQQVRVGHPSSSSSLSAPPYTAYSYDPDGNLLSQVPARGAGFAVTYGYDGLDRVRFKDVAPTNSIANPGTSDVVYTWDSSASFGSEPGELGTVSSTAVTTNFLSDLRGNPSQKRRTIGSASYLFNYYYDLGGRLLGTKYPDAKAFARKYDGALLTSVYPVNSPQLAAYASTGNLVGSPSPIIDSIAHHASGALQGLHYVNGDVTTAYDYEPNDYRLAHAATSRPGAPALLDLSYQYDVAGNLLSSTDATQPTPQLTQTFTYDSAHRLWTAGSTGVRAYPSPSIQYNYDAAGNLVQKGSLQLSYGDSGGGAHAVISGHDATTGLYVDLFHDQDGNVFLRVKQSDEMTEVESLVFDADNRMSSYSSSAPGGASSNAAYTYDENGMRVSRTAAKPGINESTTTVDDDYEVDNAQAKTLKHISIDGRRVLTVLTSVPAGQFTNELHYHPDQIGTNRLITDETGAVVQRSFSDPFGSIYAVVDGSGTSISPPNRPSQYIFSSQHADLETGLDYFGARYYDPLIGHFISSDPDLVPRASGAEDQRASGNSTQGLDGYAYVDNRPVTLVDPTGRQEAVIDSCSACFDPNFTRYEAIYRSQSAAEGLAGLVLFGVGGLAIGGYAATPWLLANPELAVSTTWGAADLLLNPGMPMALVAGPGGLGDLTAAEVRQIQSVVNQAGRPLEVVGSAARGMRRGIGTDLPIGKGPGTRSDIDFLVPYSSMEHFRGLEKQLPSLDWQGIIGGVHNPYVGPAIRFEPAADPFFVPQVSQ